LIIKAEKALEKIAARHFSILNKNILLSSSFAARNKHEFACLERHLLVQRDCSNKENDSGTMALFVQGRFSFYNNFDRVEKKATHVDLFLLQRYKTDNFLLIVPHFADKCN